MLVVSVDLGLPLQEQQLVSIHRNLPSAGVKCHQPVPSVLVREPNLFHHGIHKLPQIHLN